MSARVRIVRMRVHANLSKHAYAWIRVCTRVYANVCVRMHVHEHVGVSSRVAMTH